jgi:hypothetical protein
VGLDILAPQAALAIYFQEYTRPTSNFISADCQSKYQECDSNGNENGIKNKALGDVN